MQNSKSPRALLRFVIAAVILLCCQFSAMAQTPAAATAKPAATVVVSKGAQSYIETFFKKYKTNSDSAIDYIFGTNKLFARNASQINLLKNKLDSLQFALGKYTGRELISEKSASPSLVIYSYLAKHENQPIRFTFIFYKAQNEWTLYRFNFDDSMDQEMFEDVKINNKR
jgi:hypothetical protein